MGKFFPHQCRILFLKLYFLSLEELTLRSYALGGGMISNFCFSRLSTRPQTPKKSSWWVSSPTLFLLCLFRFIIFYISLFDLIYFPFGDCSYNLKVSCRSFLLLASLSVSTYTYTNTFKCFGRINVKSLTNAHSTFVAKMILKVIL